MLVRCNSSSHDIVACCRVAINGFCNNGHSFINGDKLLFAATTPDKAEIVVAFYESNKLINTETKPIVQSGMIGNTKIPDESTSIKIMLWDELTTMQPLRKARTLIADGTGWKLGE